LLSSDDNSSSSNAAAAAAIAAAAIATWQQQLTSNSAAEITGCDKWCPGSNCCYCNYHGDYYSDLPLMLLLSALISSAVAVVVVATAVLVKQDALWWRHNHGQLIAVLTLAATSSDINALRYKALLLWGLR
jgi:hypothetical protein